MVVLVLVLVLVVGGDGAGGRGAAEGSGGELGEPLVEADLGDEPELLGGPVGTGEHVADVAEAIVADDLRHR